MTKAESLKLFSLGVFGNRPSTYTPEEFLSLAFTSPNRSWMVRRSQTGGSSTTGPDNTDRTKEICATLGPDDIISEYISPLYATVQGEFGLNPTPFLRVMRYPQMAILKMLDLVQHIDFHGLAAKTALRQYLPMNFEHIENLAYEFGSPTSPTVVEFSLHNRPVGTNNHPLIVWEVRNT